MRTPRLLTPIMREPHAANAPRRRRFGIDEVLVDHLQAVPGSVVADLGCGSGHTLATAADRTQSVELVGLDRDAEALEAAAALLAGAGASVRLLRADLADPLPLPSASISHVLCHNVLEQLADPPGLIAEAARILAAGGRSVWSHPDYDSVVISGADAKLTRQIVRAFADYADATMDHADPRMGRKLPGLIAQSALRTVHVTTNVLLSTTLSGPARFRVQSTVAALRGAAQAAHVDLSVEQLDAWLESLEKADREDRFLYSHVTYIVVAERP